MSFLFVTGAKVPPTELKVLALEPYVVSEKRQQLMKMQPTKNSKHTNSEMDLLDVSCCFFAKPNFAKLSPKPQPQFGG